ncbi:hypothetical protein L596_001530 [Steinernema carpocapsae]|uniref:CCHC-type domain-containing protein n=1 Tax=Steinernema carpocapsae TaxID=34508 RepID=A0A4U8UMJ1_STECR|nr:hypothetical protein L596_001530 [Steinernema carpocapsae]
MDKPCGQTLQDIKKFVTKQVRSGQITRVEGGEIVKKWKMREHRRVGRQTGKKAAQFCFNCRETGHKVSDCPHSNETQITSGMCFKCGSTEHTSSKCPRKNVKGFPYASCFICKQQGHLSRDCPENSKGIYPNGGSCNVCGSQMHLRKDCPSLQTKEKKFQDVELVADGPDVGGDMDVPMKKVSSKQTEDASVKKGPKRVKF